MNHVVSLELDHQLLMLREQQLGQDLEVSDRLDQADSVQLVVQLLLADLVVQVAPVSLARPHGLRGPSADASRKVVHDVCVSVLERLSAVNAVVQLAQHVVLQLWVFVWFLAEYTDLT